MAEIINGIVQPVRYQVYNSLIESKKSMEPIAMAVGIGPIVGFENVDLAKPYFNIAGTNPGMNLLSWQIQVDEQGGLRTTNISDTDNKAGFVKNVFISPSGMLNVAPDFLDFRNIPMNIDPVYHKVAYQYFAVKVKHVYIGSVESNPPVPSILDFTAMPVTLTRTNGLPHNFLTLSQMPMTEMFDLLATQGFNIDHNTEILIGIYIVGNPTNETDTKVLGLMARRSYTSLIPFNYIWPPKYNMSRRLTVEIVRSVETEKARREEADNGIIDLLNLNISTTNQYIEAVENDLIETAKVRKLFSHEHAAINIPGSIPANGDTWGWTEIAGTRVGNVVNIYGTMFWKRGNTLQAALSYTIPYSELGPSIISGSTVQGINPNIPPKQVVIRGINSGNLTVAVTGFPNIWSGAEGKLNMGVIRLAWLTTGLNISCNLHLIPRDASGLSNENLDFVITYITDTPME